MGTLVGCTVVCICMYEIFDGVTPSATVLTFHGALQVYCMLYIMPRSDVSDYSREHEGRQRASDSKPDTSRLGQELAYLTLITVATSARLLRSLLGNCLRHTAARFHESGFMSS